MALLLPVILILLGIAVWSYSMSSFGAGSGLEELVILFGVMIFGPLACGVYGAYIWLKTGMWGAITILDVLCFKPGDICTIGLEKVHWVGLQKLSDDYLASNIGFTLFFVPVAVLGGSFLLIPVWDAVHKQVKGKK